MKSQKLGDADALSKELLEAKKAKLGKEVNYADSGEILRVRRADEAPVIGEEFTDTTLGFSVDRKTVSWNVGVLLVEGDDKIKFVASLKSALKSSEKYLGLRRLPKVEVVDKQIVFSLDYTTYKEGWPTITFTFYFPKILSAIAHIPQMVSLEYKSELRSVNGDDWEGGRVATYNFLERYKAFYLVAPSLSLVGKSAASYIASLGNRNLLYAFGVGPKRRGSHTFPFFLRSDLNKFQVDFYDDLHEKIIFNRDIELFLTLRVLWTAE